MCIVRRIGFRLHRADCCYPQRHGSRNDHAHAIANDDRHTYPDGYANALSYQYQNQDQNSNGNPHRHHHPLAT